AQLAEQTLRLRIVRLQAQGFFGLGASLGVAAELCVRHPEVEMRAGAVGVQAYRLLQLRAALRLAAGQRRGDALGLVKSRPGLPDLAARRVGPRGFVEPRAGLVEAALLNEAHDHLCPFFRPAVVQTPVPVGDNAE